MKLHMVIKLFAILIFAIASSVGCSSIKSKKIPRKLTSSTCTAECIMIDDSRITHISIFPVLAKEYGKITGTSFEDIYNQCSLKVANSIKNNELPYWIPQQVLNPTTIFQPKLYKFLHKLVEPKVSFIANKSVVATPSNSCE